VATSSVEQFEEKVWEVAGVRVIVRAPEGAQVQAYTSQKAANQGWTVTKFLADHVQPCVGDYEVTVIQGNGEEPRGNTLLRSVRSTY
jgi:hypothetical protein